MKVGDLVSYNDFTAIGILVGTTKSKYATVWLIRALPGWQTGEFITTYLSNLEPLNESR